MVIQDKLDRYLALVQEKQMVINDKKTWCVVFNTCVSVDIFPQLLIGNSLTPIDLVEQYKLLGVVLPSDLTWVKNTEYICTRALKKLVTQKTEGTQS